tara:strand:- start:71 stop:247 length:177 start_codon:yes stop_codon:yes gene_type:complete
MPNNITNIINAWMPNRPLKPSMKLDPLIINKKHIQIKINENMSISKRLFKNSRPVFSI